MTTITLSVSSNDVQLKEGQGSITASVTNGGPAPERVVLAAFPADGGEPPQKTYTDLPDTPRTIGPGQTEQYTVAFDTAGAPAGRRSVKLIAYSADEAPEDYADQAQVVTFVVPEAAQPGKKRSLLWLWISLGALVLVAAIGTFAWALLKDVTVPAVVGRPQAEAVKLLQDAGFSVTSNEVESSEPPGNVLTQSPAGNKPAPRGSDVTIGVAVPKRTAVPNVLGKTIEQAKTDFAAAQIQLDFTQGSACQASTGGFLGTACVVTGVNPDVGTRVNLNALVLVRTEVRSPVFGGGLVNICRDQPDLCKLKQ
jgi:hypothetical protein